MAYIIAAICIIAVIMICVAIFIKVKKTPAKQELSVTVTKYPIVPSSGSKNEVIINVEQISADTIENETELMEITDSKVLAHVNNLIPELFQVGNAVNNAVQAVKANGEVLYRAIIPNGEKLARSRNVEGAFRGIYHGVDGKIKGHADLLKVETQTGTAIASNAVSAVMGIASIIVGQYYMANINSELSEINDGLSKISDFQNNEYKSKVFALTAQIKKIANFQVEILENQELREAEIARLNSLEQECIELLGQANLTIANFATKKDLDYDQYNKELNDAHNWYICQKTLIETLHEIEDLRYTLHLGAVSREQCNALLPTYINQVQRSQQELTAWHEMTTKRLGIETSSARRKRNGFDGVLHWLPGLFNDDLNFRSISDNTVSMIELQAAGFSMERKETVDLFREDVQLIAKDGKLYYLPLENND